MIFYQSDGKVGGGGMYGSGHGLREIFFFSRFFLMPCSPIVRALPVEGPKRRWTLR